MTKGHPLRIIAAIALMGIVGLILVWAARALVLPSITQPIAFNHRQHVEDAGLECVDCHRHAVDGVRATIPNIEVCAGCHEESLGESEEEARVARHIRDQEPIPWRKIYWVSDHVYFSHRLHTTIAGIECATCHGEVGQQTSPLTRPLVRITMSGCVKCHEETGAVNDCVACHR